MVGLQQFGWSGRQLPTGGVRIDRADRTHADIKAPRQPL